MSCPVYILQDVEEYVDFRSLGIFFQIVAHRLLSLSMSIDGLAVFVKGADDATVRRGTINEASHHMWAGTQGLRSHRYDAETDIRFLEEKVCQQNRCDQSQRGHSSG